MILSYQTKSVQFTVNEPQTLVLRMKQQIHQTYNNTWFGYKYGAYDYVINVSPVIKTQAKEQAMQAFLSTVYRNQLTYIDHNGIQWLVNLDVNETNFTRTGRGLARCSLTMIGRPV